jgi:hypothetical protein
MANRYQDDLRFIVGIDSLKGGLNRPEPKSKIKGGRGISYFAANGTTETMSGNTPSSSKDETDEETDEAIDEEAAADTGNGTTQPGGQDINDGLLDSGSKSGNALDDSGISPPTNPDGTTTNFDGMKKDGSAYSGIGGLVDCETGDCVSVRYDGNFSAPEGWDNPDSHIPDGYVDGRYWRSLFRDNGVYTAPEDYFHTWQDAFDYMQAVAPYSIYWISDGESSGSAFYGTYRWPEDDPANKYAVGIFSVSCASTYNEMCAEDPTITEWPVDKCTEVSYDAESGTFKTHTADTKVHPSMAGGVAVLPELCDGFKKIGHYPQADGTMAVYDSAAGIAKFIGPDGKVIGYGDGAAVTAGQP